MTICKLFASQLHSRRYAGLYRPLFTNNLVNNAINSLGRKNLIGVSRIVSNCTGDYRIGYKLLNDLSRNNPNNRNERYIDILASPAHAFFERARSNTGISGKYLQSIDAFLGSSEILKMSWYEVWEVIIKIINAGSRGQDPDSGIKNISRSLALDLLSGELGEKEVSFTEAVKIAAFANGMDMASDITRKAIEKGEFSLNDLQGFGNIKLRTDDTEIFRKRFNDDNRQRTGIILVDNVGEMEIVIAKLAKNQLEAGHTVVIAGKDDFVVNDATAQDIIDSLQKEPLKRLISGHEDQIVVVSSGSLVYGLDLARITNDLASWWKKADYFIAMGQGNYYTTRRFGLTLPGLYILTVKIAEELTLVDGIHRYANGDLIAEFYDPHK